MLEHVAEITEVILGPSTLAERERRVALAWSWERYNRVYFYLGVGAPAWWDPLEPKATGK